MAFQGTFGGQTPHPNSSQKFSTPFSCTLRRRLFLGKRWAAKRSSLLLGRTLLYRRDGDILKQREKVLRKRTHELRPSPASAKRPSSDDSLKTEEEGCSKRHRRERSITRVSSQLRKKYHMTVSDGDVFEVPPLVETSYGSLQAFDFTEDPKEELQIYSGVKDALVKYNQSMGTDYELVEILNTNSAVVRGMIYYVTFTGNSIRSQHLETFQAKFWVDFTDKIHFLYCREKC